LTDIPIGELAMLRRKGTIDDYSKRFMSLSYRDPLLMEPQQIQLYITGLGNPLRTDVALQQEEHVSGGVAAAAEPPVGSRYPPPPGLHPSW
jgi:hypothetical protein